MVRGIKIAVIITLLGVVFGSCDRSPKKNSVADLKHTTLKIPVVDSEDLANRLYTYYHHDASNQVQYEENKIIEYAVEHGLDLTRDSTGLYYMIVEKGIGGYLKEYEKGTCFYRGYTLDGKEFDSNFGKSPLRFTVGELIYGWNVGLTKIPLGSKALFVIPSRMAYWERGHSDKIGPYESLVFEIELLL